MGHALVTIIAPLDLDRVAAVEATIDKLGNPARTEIRAALDTLEAGEHGTHFASLHATKNLFPVGTMLINRFVPG